MRKRIDGNGVGERQLGIPAGSGQTKFTEVTATAAAWWLSIGEADPALFSRFMYGTPDDAKRRAHIAAQMSRLIDAAEIAGISDTLTGILADLFGQPSAGLAAPSPAAALRCTAAVLVEAATGTGDEPCPDRTPGAVIASFDMGELPQEETTFFSISDRTGALVLEGIEASSPGGGDAVLIAEASRARGEVSDNQ